MIRANRPGLTTLLLMLLLWAPALHAQPLTADASVPSAPTDASSGASGDDAASASSDANGLSVFGAQLRPAPTVQAARAPSPQELAALIEMEHEVDGFISRGRGFRQSINGLLAREHGRQLDRLRRNFTRQIEEERRQEGDARRRAIDVFLRFLEQYPNDREHTPDVMFRLAELYFDEAAYAKLEADERMDNEAARRRAMGLPADDLQPAPTDYRCSVLLYRHIIARFGDFRLNDATHYLLGWVLKEMGHEDEAMSSYRGLVCHNQFQYDGAHGFDLMATLQGNGGQLVCPRLFDILRPTNPELITPVVAVQDADAGADGGAPQAADNGFATGDTVMPIPSTYQTCTPLPGSTPGQPSRYLGETWYFVGDYHFDNARDDLGNATAIAAYQQAMQASLRRRPVSNAPTPTNTPAIQGAGQLDGPDTAASRARFDRNMEYGQFWPKALYKVGWAFFRMQHGYPNALESFAHLLDYYDFAGAEVAAQGNRSDTIKWIGVIFSESDWGAGPGDDVTRCQQVVETVSHPPADAPRPFDCAGIVRIVSPYDAERVATARETDAARRTQPVPGRVPFIPQDRAWTPEAYLELANDYFQQTKYYEAVTLYRIFLALYPLHFQAPRVAEGIALAYERQHQYDQAISARGRLAQYTEGTAWWNNNNDHPNEQRYADTIARNSLHDTAILHHQRAGQLRNEGVQHAARARAATDRNVQATELSQAAESLRRAREEYNSAVQAYTAFIENYPNDDSAYEFRYNRGDALYWSQRYQEAARAYADVRESNENDTYLAPAAYMAVKSLEMHIRAEAQARRMDACVAARAGIPPAELTDDNGATLLTGDQSTTCASLPSAAGTPATVTPITIPEVVRALMDARIAYANRVPAPLDTAEALRDVVQVDAQQAVNNPPYRPKFAYLNARTLMRFGQISDAEPLYREILRVYCTDATVAGAAFVDLNNIMDTMGRADDREALAREQAASTCVGIDRSTITTVLTDSSFRHALDVFHQAEHAPADQAAPIYERAAREMEEAVRQNPNHQQAALATYYVALAYERTGRFDTATQTYIRIAQNYNNLNGTDGHELTGENLSQRVNILEQSNFRAAVNLERIFDYDNAIRYHNTVATDARFNTAQDHAAHVHDALASIALINTNLGRWAPARLAWQSFLPRTTPGRERSEAEYRLAEIPYRAHEWAEAIRSLQDYLRRIPGNGDNAQYRVQAQYDIALAYREQNDQTRYRSALREVVNVFRASGQQPGSVAAAWAAEALYRDLDDQVTAFNRSTFTQGTPDQLAAQLARFKEQLRQIDASAQQVVQLRGGEYSIGALTRQGEAHEYLATQEARISTLVQPSAAQLSARQRAEAAIARLERVAHQVERTNPDQAQQLMDQAGQLRLQVDEAAQQANATLQTHFDEEAAAERKLAIINYAVAINTARTSNIPTAFAARALEFLRHEENTPLVADALTHQRIFQYRPGMFDSEAPGQNVTQNTPVATPRVAEE